MIFRAREQVNSGFYGYLLFAETYPRIYFVLISSRKQVNNRVKVSPPPLANADNFDTGCKFSEEKFCEGINRSAKV